MEDGVDVTILAYKALPRSEIGLVLCLLCLGAVILHALVGARISSPDAGIAEPERLLVATLSLPCLLLVGLLLGIKLSPIKPHRGIELLALTGELALISGVCNTVALTLVALLALETLVLLHGLVKTEAVSKTRVNAL